MSSAFLNLTQGSVSQDIYSHALRTAYLRGKRVYRPSFAEFSDPEIHFKIMRDPVIAHAIQFRKSLVAGSRWNLEPFDNSPINKKAAAIMEKILDCIYRFSASRFNLADAIIRGSSVSFIEGNKQELVIDDKRMMFWTPTRLKDVDVYRFRQQVDIDGRVFWEISTINSTKNTIWERLQRPELFIMHLYDDVESSLNYGRGLLQSIFYFYFFKQELLELGLKGAERWAMGIINAGINSLRETVETTSTDSGATSSTIATKWLDVLENMRAQHALIHDKDDDFGVITGGLEGHQMVDNFIKYFDNTLRTLILGANLPTQASEGGSYAMAVVQENSTQALVRYDRQLLSETLTRFLVRFVWNMNKPQFAALGLADAHMPRFSILDEKSFDPDKEMRIIASALAAGISLRKDEVYERLGFSIPDENDAVITPRETPAEEQLTMPRELRQLDLGLDDRSKNGQ